MTYSILGIDAAGKRVIINQSARLEGLHILGGSGSGKTSLFENLAIQDINQDRGICVITSHRSIDKDQHDLILRIIERMEYERRYADKQKKRERMQRRLEEDVIFLDIRDPIYAFGLNLFYCEDPADDFKQEDTIERVYHILEKVYNITDKTPQMRDYFLNITRTLLYTPQSTALDIPRLLTERDFRQHLLANVPDEEVQRFWKQFESKGAQRREEEISAVTNKLGNLLRPAFRVIFGQPITTIRLPEIINQRKILLIRLDSFWGVATSLIGSMIIGQFLQAAYTRGNVLTESLQDFNLYVDEFQKFASDDFAALFTEARKYKVSLTVAHQVLDQLDPTLQATCKAAANRVAFRVSDENAEAIAATFVDQKRYPGPPRREPLRTPVMEPIQFMRWRGAHPGGATQQFMARYGRILVDEAKQEEQAERDHQREMDRYEYDPIDQRDVGFSDTDPSSLFRKMLVRLNDLFYEAMKAGERGQNPDDLPLPDEVFGNFIWAVIPEQRAFLDAWKEYFSSGEERSADPSDLAARKEVLHQQLADLLAYQQKKLLSLRQKFKAAQEHLIQCMQAYLRAEVSIVRAICVIVRRGSTYYVGSLNNHRLDRSEDAWYCEIVYHYHEQLEDPKTTRRDLTPDNSNWGTPSSLAFASLEAAVYYFWRQMHTHQVWFHAERAIGDLQWWLPHRARVLCMGKGDFPRTIYSHSGIEELDVWILSPEVEKVWYNDDLLEVEVERRLRDSEQTRNDPGIDYVKSIARSFRWTSSSISESILNLEQASRTFEEEKQSFQHDTYTLAQEIEQATERINHELELIELIEQQRSSYETCATELEVLLRQAMRELAEAPVLDESGLTREVPTELPSAEVEARVARELHQQPKYQAHVRVIENTNVINSIITTLPPIGGINQQELLTLLEEIRKRNHQAGYLRRRSDVAREIASRHQQPPDEPPPSPTQPRPPSSPPPPPAPMKRRKKVL
jgi:predicted ATPase